MKNVAGMASRSRSFNRFVSCGSTNAESSKVTEIQGTGPHQSKTDTSPTVTGTVRRRGPAPGSEGTISAGEKDGYKSADEPSIAGAALARAATGVANGGPATVIRARWSPARGRRSIRCTHRFVVAVVRPSPAPIGDR
ncbi:hypothetical protein PBRA_008943 [Plasmodiophora brassicae]|uniref:Uncharacterized protein n=1 Tax=Plasmodiophora brassicae TaxID=37360 RepID=A0A0G4J4R1_PLABS|nr:hypothetical protein PBRA_008943 [Plasmodiophora brassicae]